MKASFDTLGEIDDIEYDEFAEETTTKRATVQYPEGRTYGECVEDEKRSICMINGRFVPTIRIKDKPVRLSRTEALRYYTKKLRKVWETIPCKKYYENDRDLQNEISENSPINSKDKKDYDHSNTCKNVKY